MVYMSIVYDVHILKYILSYENSFFHLDIYYICINFVVEWN